MLAHPRSEYIPEFRKIMLIRHTARVMEMRERMHEEFEAQVEKQIEGGCCTAERSGTRPCG